MFNRDASESFFSGPYARDWNPERNDGLAAAEVMPGSMLRWWKCKHGHEQHMMFRNRLHAGGCTACPVDDRVAVPETKTGSGSLPSPLDARKKDEFEGMSNSGRSRTDSRPRGVARAHPPHERSRHWMDEASTSPLSITFKGIDVEIGYAVWAGIGAIGAAFLSPVLFGETLTLVRTFWLAVIIADVVWLKLADSATISATQHVHAGEPGASDQQS